MADVLAKARRIARMRKNFLRLAEWKKFETDHALQACEDQNRQIIALLQESCPSSAGFSKMLLTNVQRLSKRKNDLEGKRAHQAEIILHEQYRLRSSLDRLAQAEREDNRQRESKILLDLIEISQIKSRLSKS